VITETAVIADIDAILIKLKGDLDKVRAVADKVDNQIDAIDREFFVKVIPGLGPLATIVTELANGLDAIIDAMDDVADGLASVKTQPTAVTTP
jgi:hypothetical protein